MSGSLVLVGTGYWRGMLDWMREVQLPAGAISEADLGLLRLTDDPDEAVSIVRAYASRAHARLPDEGDLR